MTEIGTKGHIELKVEEHMTAESMKSGNLPVLATPYLAAVMEQACAESVADGLEAGKSTVGTALDIKHLAPTPVGMAITCDSTLVEADGRRLVFEVAVRDECETIGVGRHERFVVDGDRFTDKARAKLEKIGRRPV